MRDLLSVANLLVYSRPETRTFAVICWLQQTAIRLWFNNWRPILWRLHCSRGWQQFCWCVIL